MKTLVVILGSIIILLIAWNQVETKSRYKVFKISSQHEIDAKWNKKPWSDIESLQLDHYMGSKPEHFPVTQAKVAYDDSAIYVIFRVKDQYIKAVHSENQDPVFQDSCVEFFFTPDGNLSDGYFNLEMNCGGTMLFNHQMKPRSDRVVVSDKDIQQIEVAHTLPEIVDPEIDEKTTWAVEYRIPFSVLDNYQDFSKPVTGSVWRANFYKCADKTSHPHWLTWAPVEFPTPNFHLPNYFGILEFQEWE